MPHDPEGIILRLRATGLRLTEARLAVVRQLAAAKKPMTADEIRRQVFRSRPTIHKTTVYREIAALAAEDLLVPVRFGERAVRYELAADHHHHLVCTDCGDVEDVELDAALAKEERRIGRRTGFKIMRHALEFFGLCAACRP